MLQQLHLKSISQSEIHNETYHPKAKTWRIRRRIIMRTLASCCKHKIKMLQPDSTQQAMASVLHSLHELVHRFAMVLAIVGWVRGPQSDCFHHYNSQVIGKQSMKLMTPSIFARCPKNQNGDDREHGQQNCVSNHCASIPGLTALITTMYQKLVPSNLCSSICSQLAVITIQTINTTLACNLSVPLHRGCQGPSLSVS